MGKTSIEWTDLSWNPVTGCSKVSPGCDHCYAETLSRRFGRPVVDGVKAFKPWEGVNAAHNVVLHPDRLEEPMHVRKPSMFFTCSMGDLFHDLVPFRFIHEVFTTMAFSSRHTFQVLTKRPGRLAYFANVYHPPGWGNRRTTWGSHWPPNVWAGTSVESEKYLPRLDVLARVPAKVRFVSAEPLLGPLDLRRYFYRVRCVCPISQGEALSMHSNECLAAPALNWVIAGGESGPGFRAPDPAWFTALRDQCQGAGVPFFFKQWGGLRPGGPALLDGREWREMPETVIAEANMPKPIGADDEPR